MKVVFLDRDGVINEYPGDKQYVKSWREFKLIPESIEGIKLFNQNGFKVFVISNQAGVGKGIYSQTALENITQNMCSTLKQHGAFIDQVYYCIHRNEDRCFCRKPQIGLLKQALSDFNFQPKVSFFIGDSFIDMKTARNFGTKAVLLFSGKERRVNASSWEFLPDYMFDDLHQAARHLCAQSVL